MSASNFLVLRLYEQLRSVWKNKDKEQPFVRGYLLTKPRSGTAHCQQLQTASTVLNGYRHPPNHLEHHNHHHLHQNGGNELYWGSQLQTTTETEVVERWFTLLGHALFYCTSKDSQEYAGAMLTDIFSPVMARVDDRTLHTFGAPETQQANALYLKGMFLGEVELLLCPKSPDEKREWLEKLQLAGLNVPTRSHDEKQSRAKDGREKVVVVSGSFNESLYLNPSRQSLYSPTLEKSWREEWRKAAKKVLALPDAAQIRMKFGVLQKFHESEHRYCNDLHTLVEFYYRPLKLALISGYVNIQWEQLDAIFLNCESLLMLHKLLLSRIEACVKEPSPQFGELMCQFIPHMNVYTEFVKNHDQSIKVLEACLLNPSFTDFLENHHFSHDCDAQQLRMLLHQPVTRLEIYQAFIEEVLRQTSENHIDYRSLGSALETIQDLKTDITKQSSMSEKQDKMLSIIKTVGPAGFLLLEPECRLVLEGELFLPASSKWVTGTIKRRPVLCYLYSNALVVIAKDKKIKSRSQIFPLCGASVYEHVSRTGEVTYARDPEVEVRALKLYSPNGPRNGVVLIFLTQSNKNLWLVKIAEMITMSTPADSASSPIDLSPPTGRRHMRKSSLFTPPTSPPQTPVVLSGRRSSAIAVPVTTLSSPSSHGSTPVPPSRTASDKSLLVSRSPTAHHHHLKRTQMQGLSNSTTNLLDESPLELSPLPARSVFTSSSSHHSRLVRAASMTSLGPDDASGINEIVRPRHEVYSIPSLFSLLISNPPSPHYAATFFLTYRMFTNAHEVLDAVIEGHRKELNSRNSAVVSLSTESLRFFNTLKLWVNKYYVDFHHDVTLKQVLLVYLDGLKCHSYVHEKEMELADSIIKSVNDRGHIPMVRRSKLKIQIPKTVSDVDIPTSFDDIPTETMARQLTWAEHELYSRMKPYEFLQQKWTKKNKHELAPNICYVIQRFNQMTLWIAKEILSCDQPRRRCGLVQKLVAIAEYCLELRNYVTIFQITAALCSSSIQRLKKTWDLLPQNVSDKFKELQRLTTIDGGSKVYRDIQKSSPSPSVPYIGPYLNQLVSIEVGMPTFVRDPPEHVNFSKLSKLGHVIEELMKFQNPKYNIVADAPVLKFLERALESASGFDDDQRYSRSMELEPQPQINGIRKKSLYKLLST